MFHLLVMLGKTRNHIMAQLHAMVILKSSRWEFTQDHFPKGLRTLYRLFSWDFQYFPKKLELLPLFTACCFCCDVKWCLCTCHAQQENEFSLSTSWVSHGAVRRTMTLFLGYFLLLLPKWIAPLVKDMISPAVSPLSYVMCWGPGDGANLNPNLTLEQVCNTSFLKFSYFHLAEFDAVSW